MQRHFGCDFGGGFAQIDRHFGGRRRRIAEIAGVEQLDLGKSLAGIS